VRISKFLATWALVAHLGLSTAILADNRNGEQSPPADGPRPEYPAPPTNFGVDSPQVQPVVGLRPFREGGIRLETEKVGDTVVVHNYGHGGAGLTLSWGTVFEAVSQGVEHLKEPGVKVAVIGGGVIGFTTADELQRLGHSVTIYSEEFFPSNVSNIAGGLWSPVSVDLEAASPTEVERLKRIQIDSWRTYRALEKLGWPVRSMPMFVTEEAREKSGLDLFEALPEIFQVTHHARLPIKGVTQGGYEVSTILIDTPQYMRRLKAKVEQKGAVLIQRKFRSMQEIADEVGAGAVVFNCTGLGARELAKDANVIPVRGDLVYIKAHAGFEPAKIGYMAFYGPHGTDYMFPRSSEIVVGGTFRKGENSTAVEAATCAQKLASFARFFGTEPKT
jgi:D-amino-acid oxidase